MQQTETLSALNSLHFMPGWEISARRAGTNVQLTVTWPTVNSNQDCARAGYPERVNLIRQTMVDPSRFSDREALYAGVLSWLVDLQIHESREFFRVGDAMEAPFHPHRFEGEALWADYFGQGE